MSTLGCGETDAALTWRQEAGVDAICAALVTGDTLGKVPTPDGPDLRNPRVPLSCSTSLVG